MDKFPSIKQFRDVIREVGRKARFAGFEAGEPVINPTAVLPTLHFKGSVKLHGTNAAVVFSPEGITFQSRERELTVETDNAGFMNHMLEHMTVLRQVAAQIESTLGLHPDVDNIIAVYGEWCGGDIQRGVAINGLPKMFVVFAIKVNGEWQDMDAFDLIRDTSASIYNITQFPQYEIDIDFERPEVAQNALGVLTQKVESACPVGAAFEKTGTGEGIVWRCTSDATSDLWFKVKGEKHSASQVKTLAAVDVEAIAAVHDFVAATVTGQRLEQGLQNLVGEQQKPFALASVGDFIRWVYGDIMKEEADTVAANGFDPKKLGGPISVAAKRWYFEKLNAAAVI